jgi:hypothetical protein
MPAVSMIRRLAGVLMGLIPLSLLVSACSSPPTRPVAQVGSTSATNSSASSTSGGKYASALAYSRCMRAHGVPNYPDPKQGGGGGIEIGSGSGVDTQSPEYKSAQQSCKDLLPDGGQPTQTEQQHEIALLLQVSQCMRAHGITGFPDPTLSPPSNRAGHSDIMSNDGVWLAIPNSIDARSRAFVRAAAACNFAQS